MAETKRLPTSGTRKGNGTGWGGPAKGSGNGKLRQKFKGPGPGRGHYSIEGEARADRNKRHAEEMRKLYYTVAHDLGEPTTIRLSAATHLLNLIEGLPVAMVAPAEAGPYSLMSDEELEVEIERTRKMVEEYERIRREDGDSDLHAP